MEKQEIDELLRKLATDTLLPEEAARLREALAQEGSKEQELLHSLDAWEKALNSEPPTAKEKNRAKQNYKAIVHQLQPESGAAIVPLHGRGWLRSAGFRAACILGIVIGGGAGAFYLLNGRISGSSGANQSLAWQEVNTKMGERRKLTLADRSVIFLNGGTTIKYTPTFPGKVREVQLVTGEIFLEVEPNEAQPFLVRTDSLTVQVLGTSFMVSNNVSGHEVNVAVKTGRVSFSTLSRLQTMVLLPGKAGVYNKKDGNMQEVDVNKDAVAGWTKNEFIFEDATLSEVLSAIEKSYGFRYRIGNKQLAGKRFRASFNQHTPQEILSALSRLGHFNYAIKDSTITIK